MINPLVDIQRMDVKTQNYTMSAVHNEGAMQGDDAIRVLSADGLEVIIDHLGGPCMARAWRRRRRR